MRVGHRAVLLNFLDAPRVVRDVAVILKKEFERAAGTFDEIGVDDADSDQTKPAFARAT